MVALEEYNCLRNAEPSTLTKQNSELWLSELSVEKRSALWKTLLLGGLCAEPSVVEDEYRALCQLPCTYDDVIRRDVDRTLPREELFREKHGKGQSALFRLLHALAVQHGDIGYVQSLNFVVATLVNIFPDDEALVFSFARSLLFRHSLADFYRPSFPKLGVAVWQFDRLVEGFLPKAHAALEAHGINAEFYGMQWFLTLFSSDLPQKVVVRVWDRFLIVGWQAIAQVALALVASIQDELWDLAKLDNSCEAMKLLKNFTRRRSFEAGTLLQAALKYDVSHRMLSDLEAAYSQGEAPERTKLTMEENANTGGSRWFVQRGRSNSSSSCSTSLSSSMSHQETSSPASKSVSKVTSKGTLLPFIIHNLDTGETTLLEEEWSSYVREEQSLRNQPLASDVFPRQINWRKAELNTSYITAKECGASGGSFWVQSQQVQALRAMGKA